MASQRILRLNGELRRALSDIIQNDIKDPRIPAVCSVSKVDLSGDQMHAKVGISLLGSPEVVRQAMEAINGASGFIAHEMAARVRMRRVPKLHFELDTSIAYAAHINQVINDLEGPHGPGNE